MDSSSSAVSAGESLSLEKVAAAWKTVRPALWPTPLLRCPVLDELCGFRVWLKPENLQRTGSYKIRGAYYELHQLQEEGRVHKVVAASAGNHAQGVAYAARATVLDLRRSWRSGPLLSDRADIEILIETEDEQHGKEILEGLAQEAKAHNFELLLENPRPEKPKS